MSAFNAKVSASLHLQVSMKGFTLGGPFVIGSDKNKKIHLIEMTNHETCDFPLSLHEQSLPITLDLENPVEKNMLGLSCFEAISVNSVKFGAWKNVEYNSKEILYYKPTPDDLKNLTYLENLSHEETIIDRCNIFVKIESQMKKQTKDYNQLSFKVTSATQTKMQITCFNYPYEKIFNITNGMNVLFINLKKVYINNELQLRFDSSSAVVSVLHQDWLPIFVQGWNNSKQVQSKHSGMNCMY